MRGFNREGVVRAIRDAGGQVYAVTSEPQALARNAQEEWETGMEHVGDPHREILDSCIERGWLSLFSADFGDLNGALPDWVSHPGGGYFQPGVLAVRSEGRVLYRWRCRPSRENIGGAVARPKPDYVWREVQAALQEPADAPDAALDEAPELDASAPPWPVFVLLLLANGWFLRPVPFNYRPGENTVPARIRNAFLRLTGFVGLWVAAGLFLPTWAVALAFTGWMVKVAPGIRLVNERFQNVGPTEEPAGAR